MKFKDNSVKITNSFYEKIRYNPNTIGKHFIILNGKYNIDKTQTGIFNILSLITKIYKVEITNPNESLNALIKKVESEVGESNEL